MFVVGCAEKAQIVATCEDGFTTIDLSKISGCRELKLSEIVEELEYINVGEDFYWMGVAISDNYVLAGAPWRLYERETGKTVAELKKINKGAQVYDVKISEKDNRVYLMGWNAKAINIFDLKGNYLGDIPLAYMVPKGKFFIDGNRVTITTMPLEELAISPIWVQDTLGNVVQLTKNALHFATLPLNYSHEVRADKIAGEISYATLNAFNLPDTLYNYNPKTNVITPRATIQIKDLRPTEDYTETIWRTIIEMPDYFLCNVACSTHRGDNFYESELGVTFIVNKDDLTGTGIKIINDYIPGEEVHPICFANTGGYYLTLINNKLAFGRVKQ